MKIEHAAESPSSERWHQYYSEARTRRLAQGGTERTIRAFKRWRARQRALAIAAFVTLGLLVAIFYALLVR
jgi:hypothetical protein